MRPLGVVLYSTNTERHLAVGGSGSPQDIGSSSAKYKSAARFSVISSDVGRNRAKLTNKNVSNSFEGSFSPRSLLRLLLLLLWLLFKTVALGKYVTNSVPVCYLRNGIRLPAPIAFADDHNRLLQHPGITSVAAYPFSVA